MNVDAVFRTYHTSEIIHNSSDVLEIQSTFNDNQFIRPGDFESNDFHHTFISPAMTRFLKEVDSVTYELSIKPLFSYAHELLYLDIKEDKIETGPFIVELRMILVSFMSQIDIRHTNLKSTILSTEYYLWYRLYWLITDKLGVGTTISPDFKYTKSMEHLYVSCVNNEDFLTIRRFYNIVLSILKEEDHLKLKSQLDFIEVIHPPFTACILKSVENLKKHNFNYDHMTEFFNDIVTHKIALVIFHFLSKHKSLPPFSDINNIINFAKGSHKDQIYMIFNFIVYIEVVIEPYLKHFTDIIDKNAYENINELPINQNIFGDVLPEDNTTMSDEHKEIIVNNNITKTGDLIKRLYDKTLESGILEYIPPLKIIPSLVNMGKTIYNYFTKNSTSRRRRRRHDLEDEYDDPMYVPRGLNILDTVNFTADERIHWMSRLRSTSVISQMLLNHHYCSMKKECAEQELNKKLNIVDLSELMDWVDIQISDNYWKKYNIKNFTYYNESVIIDKFNTVASNMMKTTPILMMKPSVQETILRTKRMSRLVIDFAHVPVYLLENLGDNERNPCTLFTGIKKVTDSPLNVFRKIEEKLIVLYNSYRILTSYQYFNDKPSRLVKYTKQVLELKSVTEFNYVQTLMMLYLQNVIAILDLPNFKYDILDEHENYIAKVHHTKYSCRFEFNLKHPLSIVYGIRLAWGGKKLMSSYHGDSPILYNTFIVAIKNRKLVNIKDIYSDFHSSNIIFTSLTKCYEKLDTNAHFKLYAIMQDPYFFAKFVYDAYEFI